MHKNSRAQPAQSVSTHQPEDKVVARAKDGVRRRPQLHQRRVGRGRAADRQAQEPKAGSEVDTPELETLGSTGRK